MRNKVSCYLGGKMGGLTYEEMNSWRREVLWALCDAAENVGSGIEVINPVRYFNFEEKRQQNEVEVMKFDLSKVKKCDILLVNAKGLNTSIGTCIEIYEAYKQEIPVLTFGDSDDYENLHPWIKCCITRHDKNFMDTVEYIKDFYMC